MIETIWTYTVKPGRATEFERRYAEHGDGAQLFRRSAGYRGTRLLRQVGEEARYATIHGWDSVAALKAFKANFADAYRTLDQLCSELTLNEQHVGTFLCLAPD